jgi:hypothetical protein
MGVGVGSGVTVGSGVAVGVTVTDGEGVGPTDGSFDGSFDGSLDGATDPTATGADGDAEPLVSPHAATTAPNANTPAIARIARPVARRRDAPSSMVPSSGPEAGSASGGVLGGGYTTATFRAARAGPVMTDRGRAA